ncbi:DNA alkylation repair protein [Fulvivirga sp. 29W222]|uniref:DNA alkylation repair protein n=1 Tax=Fulvivirga marina TaxID=2494733 RepID=A0A937G4L2_9BACT|nr:DNA alkylation repair protein [Fulvivirga marina]MBL6449918.1 DNA alkylation repair protein [Fulvivirga marina]
MTYAQKLREYFIPYADESQAMAMKKYLRGQFDFLGIQTPLRREVTRAFLKDFGLPPVSELHHTVVDLWELPERELQLVALDLCQRMSKRINESHITTLEYMLTHKQWWDTIDLTAANLAGKYFKNYPKKIPLYIPKWRDSEDFWLNRSAILFQLKYKEETNTSLLTECILKHINSKEFFLQKAIGWVLREYSKTNPEWVRAFIKNNQLAKLSIKEGIKYL